ncbi:MAG TPA: hypothetical protein VGE07_13425, partial [Herpetosiphonaceae bacterium]
AAPTPAPSPPAAATATPAAQIGNPAASVIFEQPADGSVQAITADGERLVLVDPTAPGQSVAWQPSPDGRTIAAVIFQGVNVKSGEYDSAALWTVGVDATEPRKLLDLGAGIGEGSSPLAGGPALFSGLRRESWTADGRWIVLPSNHEGQVDLYAVAADGSEIRRLTDTPEFEFDAVVGPVGESVAYATTTSFGTGGGLGEPQAWVQPRFGEASPLTRATPGSYPSGVSVMGWVDAATPLAVIHYQPDGRGEIWTSKDGEAQAFHDLAPRAFWTVENGRLALTSPSSLAPNAAGPLFVWSGDGTAPVQVSDAATSAHLARTFDRLLSCERDGPLDGPRALWLAGQTIPLAPGGCDNLAWSLDGYLALGPSPEQGGPALVIGPDGETIDATIPGGAIMVGWNSSTLYFFSPAPAGEWQLYLLDAAGAAFPQPLGAPFAGQPAAPRLVIR